jgi:hypothetical protein
MAFEDRVGKHNSNSRWQDPLPERDSAGFAICVFQGFQYLIKLRDARQDRAKDIAEFPRF